MSDMGNGSPDSRLAPVEVTIRRASLPDLPAIAAIERVSFSDPWSERAFASTLALDTAHFVLAEERGSGAVAGYLVASFAGGEGEIANIAVHPERRGSGVGAALLDDALAAGVERGAEAIYLEVRESNQAARALYASRGFTLAGRRRRYYQRPVEDALVLHWTSPLVRDG